MKIFGNEGLFPVWVMILYAIAFPVLFTHCRTMQGLNNEGNRVTTEQRYPTPLPRESR